MKKLIHYLIAALGVCLALVSICSGHQTSDPAYSLISGLSLLLTVCTIVVTISNNKPVYWIAILSAFSLIVVPWFIDYLRWFTLIVGLFAVSALLFTLRLMPMVKNFILHAQDGATLMEVKKMEFKNGDLIIKGKMMGTMPTVAQMRPEEVWKALSMMPFGVLLGFPAYLFKAWKTRGISEKQAQPPKYGY